jgi:phosphoesterase RecJ-like protein
VTSLPPEALLDALRAARRVVLATHSPMDGDGLGCGLALLAAFEARGRPCVFVTEAPVPRAYRWVPRAPSIVVLGANEPVPRGDVLVGLDAGEPDRLGRVYLERAPGTKVLNIDHHVSNAGYGDTAWVDPRAAATGEQVYEVLRALGTRLDPEIALLLLVSVVTDTGRFCYSSTTPRTLEIAADLVRAGADPDELQRNLFGAVPLGVHRLRARAVEALKLHAGGRLAVLTVEDGFGADLGAGAEEVKDLIDVLVSIDTVDVAALVRGLPDGTSKVSLRSKTDAANVAAFSQRHGGGGHVRAAGFSARAGPAATEARILPELVALTVAAKG